MRSMILASFFLLAACGGDDGPGDDDPVTPDADPDEPDADPGAPDAMPAATETATLQLGPGQAEEGEFEAGPGDRVHIRMTAPTASMNWNIHAHLGGDTQYVIEEKGKMTVDYWFEPTEQAEYYLMPQNASATVLEVEVQIDFYGGASFLGWL